MIVRKAAGAAAAGIVATIASAGVALSQDGISKPWQMYYQDAASPVMRDVVAFHDFMTFLITAITAFILGLMLYITWRFNAKSNPVPSKNTHNTMLEVIWTVVPTLILVIMVIPSFRILYKMDVVPSIERVEQVYGIDVAGEVTLKATGRQWFWSYEYPDEGVAFDVFMKFDDMLEGDDPRLLATNVNVVVPVNTVVKVVVTASDVIHAWAVPAFGVKIDAVPGRLNETWFLAEREGMFYGQCSELCGINHGFMPIAVEVVSQEAYDAWVAEAQARYAPAGPGSARPRRFAAAQ